MPRAQLRKEASLGFPHPMGHTGSRLAWATGDASSPESPLLWPGGSLEIHSVDRPFVGAWEQLPWPCRRSSSPVYLYP